MSWSLKNTWNSGNGEVGHRKWYFSTIASIRFCTETNVLGPAAHPKSAIRIMLEVEQNFDISSF